jgi:hypothetical protein
VTEPTLWPKHAEFVVERGGFGPYTVELLFEGQPDVDAEVLRARVAERLDEVVDLSPEDPWQSNGKQAVLLFFPSMQVTFAQGSIPSQVFLLGPTEDPPARSWATAIQQTWDFDDAADVVQRHTHTMVVGDLMAGPLPIRDRITLMTTVVAAACELLRPTGIYWLPSDLIVAPSAFLEWLAHDGLSDVGPLINVRFFDSGTDGMVMDTLGMAGLQLPDVQIHYTTLEPPWAAQKVRSVAAYLWEKGDVIEDGQTIPGLLDGELWPCRHEDSLVGPDRVVLDIDPSPYGPTRG